MSGSPGVSRSGWSHCRSGARLVPVQLRSGIKLFYASQPRAVNLHEAVVQ